MPAPELGPDPVTLPGGLVLRSATDDDVEAIVALETDAFGASDEPGVRGHLSATVGGRRTVADWTVVVAGRQVVAASALLGHRMRSTATAFPAGQIEYVATDPDHRRRGLVRHQFAWHHRRAAERGRPGPVHRRDPLPLPAPRVRLRPRLPLLRAGRARHGAGARPIPTSSCGRATAADLEAIRVLDGPGRPDGLRVERDADAWATIGAISAAGTFERLTVATRAGRLVGWIRTQAKPEDGRVYLLGRRRRP